MNLLSINGKFILEPYQSDRQLKATQGTGFAMIQQKVTVKGLKLLMDVFLPHLGNFTMDGISAPKFISKGSIVYVKEELLYTQEWAKKLYECDGIEGKFMIVDPQFVEFIDHK